MVANLARKENGEAIFVSLRELPWHREGVVVEEEMSGLEFIKVAGLDYTVQKCPLKAQVSKGGILKPVGWDKDKDEPILGVSDGETMEVEHPLMGVFRSDTGGLFPNAVGPGFEIYQNSEIIGFFEGLVQDKKIVYECAGALGNGEEAWILANIPDLSMSIRGDDSRSYMLIRNGHCGNVTLQCFPTTVRVVCANTMAMAAYERSKERWATSKGGYSIRHTRNMRDAVKAVQAAYDKVLKNFEAQKELYEFLASKPVTERTKREFFTWFALNGRDEEKVLSLFKKNKEQMSRGDKASMTRFEGVIEGLERVYESGTNQLPGTRNTVYSVLSTAIEYIDHVRSTRCSDGDDCDSKRFESSIFGSGAKLKVEVTEKAAELAELLVA